MNTRAEILTRTSNLTSPASYVPCVTIDPKVLFIEIAENVQTLIKMKQIRFSAICEVNGPSKKWLTDLDHLPKVTDGTFESYHERITEQINHNSRHRVRYQLTVNNLEKVSMPVRDWLRSFYSPIFNEMGLPPGNVYSAIFTGDYKSTTFGIHFDDEFVYHVPVIGKKRMLLWDYNQYSLPDLINRKKTEGAAVTAEPGSCSFWTPNFWHVSDSIEDGLSVSIANSCSLNMRPNLTSAMLKYLPRLCRLALTNRKAISADMQMNYSIAWAKKVKKHWVKNFKAFRKIDGQKKVTQAHRVQSMAIESTELRVKKASFPPEFHFQLDTSQAPFVYQKGGEEMVTMNGHSNKDSTSILEILDMFQSERLLKYPMAEERLNKGLLWLYQIRAVSPVAL